MDQERIYQREVSMIRINIKNIERNTINGDKSSIILALDKITNLLGRFEMAKDELTRKILDDGESIDSVEEWLSKPVMEVEAAIEIKNKMVDKLDSINKNECVRKFEYEKQKVEQQLTIQKEAEQASLRKLQSEEEWYLKKLKMKETLRKSLGNENEATKQSVKLQKYTITKFNGDYKDWLRFWNQFTVEVDNSNISNISKFNYLLELVEGKPREDILGLPHSLEGYDEAKRILQETYGKDIWVHKAMIKDLEGLTAIHSSYKIKEVHDFYNKLARTVRTLKTMQKLQTAQSFVYSLMDKLGPVREILTQNDDGWGEWGLEQLVEKLQRYIERNPLNSTFNSSDEQTKGDKKNTNVQSRPYEHRSTTFKQYNGSLYDKETRATSGKHGCVYCGLQNHKSEDCTKVLTVARRREILTNKRLCYNCIGYGHSAVNCKSRGCRKCNKKHHTSICQDRNATMDGNIENKKENMGTVLNASTTIHPTVIAKVNGEKVRIMLDTGAGSSYICTNLITKLKLKPTRKEYKSIEQLYGTVDKRVEIYKVTLESTTIPEFSIKVECANAEKETLTFLPNPMIKDVKKHFAKLRRLKFSDDEGSDELQPVHIILGAADYQRIKTTEPVVLGKNPDKDPGAELTMLGWTLSGRRTQFSSGIERSFLLNTGRDEFEQMCSLEVLGLSDTNSESMFHQDFSEKLHQTEEGFYETRMPWKKGVVKLPNNRNLALKRLGSVTTRLKKLKKLEQYNEIMMEQINEGILEMAPEKPTGEIIHYVPHQAVVKENAESTKMRIVYDCSARKVAQSPSLNDCLEVGPSLQPLIFDILVRNRMNKLCVLADVKKAFLQIRIHEMDRDAQRLIWYKDLKNMELTDLRFTRVIFGSRSSPYILGATIKKHISKYKDIYPKTVLALEEDTYVDDIQAGGETEDELIRFKNESTQILMEAGFQLHKWHSNVSKLESNAEGRSTKILGIPWNKETDQLSIDFTACINSGDKEVITKRKMLSAINSVFDVLGFSAPILITGKILYSRLCLLKLGWDQQIPYELSEEWKTWIKAIRIKRTISIPRSVLSERSIEMELHGFSDASKSAVCACIYIAVSHRYSKTSNLLVAKARIAPRDLSIPRLELVAAHTLSKLMNHVRKTLNKYNIIEVYHWVDSTAVLYWLKERGSWSQFVRNRVQQILLNAEVKWLYVPTKENPSDLGTRGVSPEKLTSLWFNGPIWLKHKENWPIQPEIFETPNALCETIHLRENVSMATEEIKGLHIFKEILSKHKYWKIIRISSFIKKFIYNCRNEEKITGPLNAEEMIEAELVNLKLLQEAVAIKSNVELKQDEKQLWRCHGKVSGYNPIFVPKGFQLTLKIIEYHHAKTLHGGVGDTMSSIRERFWIPNLRVAVKKVIRECNLCKRYRVKPLLPPTRAMLPRFRTENIEPFTVTGVDFAGPLKYKAQGKLVEKCYVALFTCACTRAVYLRLCHDLTAGEFQRILKEFVVRKGPPQMMISDNAKTFVATGKWLLTLKKDENLANYLATTAIKWRFNLSRAPWWGGLFERLIGIMKKSLSKTIGKGILNFFELEEVLLDVECVMNNRPLCYQGDQFDKQVLTPNVLMRGRPAVLLEEDIDLITRDDCALRRIKFVKSCKNHLRKRWMNEYVHAMEERQQVREKRGNVKLPEVGSMVLIKDDVKDKALLNIGRIENNIKGKDGVIRGFKIRLGNGYVIERPIQLVCDLEMGCGAESGIESEENLETKAEEDTLKREPRQAKLNARQIISSIMEDEMAD
ncbi:uncharacterized protein LOC136088288 [Hydra vulgaris]|uniref:Uncharacterized protein LOC136088288 n=1 Tax=Hydra vulgaris TaxID=6087 RepID=A0ABM4D1C2_HYDVU